MNEDIINKKFELKISSPIESSNQFSKNFTPEIRNYIKRITTDVIIMLPTPIKRQSMKSQIRNIYQNIVKEDENFLRILDIIYQNDKARFDYLSESIKLRKILAEKNASGLQLSQKESNLKK